MIISHKHKYIFIKTSKVAGTSTELFFENISFGINKFYNREKLTKDGVVGARGEFGKKSKWRNHMRLPMIKKQLNNDKIFNEYFKFSNTRNPWDRIGSGYYHFALGRKIKCSFREYVLGSTTASIPMPITDWFGDYIDDIYFIRYTHLLEDVEYVCKKLNLNYDINNFGVKKSQHREKSKHSHYSEYYDNETIEIVAQKYAKDIDYFGYEFGS